MEIEILAQNCLDEFTEFKRNLGNICPSCIRLFKTAFLDGKNDALAHICRIYDTQLTRWVEHHTWFAGTGESAEYFVNVAWSKFYYAVREARFTQFENIPQIMMYLKRCVHSSIAQYSRKLPPSSVSLDDVDEIIEDKSSATSHLTEQEVWKRICLLLPDTKEQELAECVFYKDMKPAEIQQLNNAYWKSTEQLYKEIWRIRKILRTDPMIKALLGVES